MLQKAKKEKQRFYNFIFNFIKITKSNPAMAVQKLKNIPEIAPIAEDENDMDEETVRS